MLQPVRGTHDLLFDECRNFRFVRDTGARVAALYGFEEIETPIFEFTQLFYHVGETSDIVTKETYTFRDRGDQEITLRPEGTAGVMRAVLSNGLTQSTPLKLFYAGPMFRYERPQKGRYRQFHHFGVELLGVENPMADSECIAMAAHFLQELNLNANIKLEINSLGDTDSRNNYRHALLDFMQDFKGQLSKDSQERMDRNPLRVLDSKDEGDQKLMLGAPKFRDFLNTKSEDIFASVLHQLDILGIKYEINPKIVRGLDYYCHTIFEFTTDSLGAQGTVLAGGRYDGLSQSLGGPELPGIGWACGIDRLTYLLKDCITKQRPIAMIPLGSQAEEQLLVIAQKLRSHGHAVELSYSGNMAKRLKKADKCNARWAIILGDTEIATRKILVRDLDSGVQQEVDSENVYDIFNK